MSEQKRKIERRLPSRMGPSDKLRGLLLPAGRAGIADIPGVAPDSPLSMILRRRALRRLAIASPRADAALRKLCELGVRAKLIGSMPRGTFRSTSDVDFLIEDAGPLGETAIEDIICLAMDGFPYDVVFQSRIPSHLRQHFV